MQDGLFLLFFSGEGGKRKYMLQAEKDALQGKSVALSDSALFCNLPPVAVAVYCDRCFRKAPS